VKVKVALDQMQIGPLRHGIEKISFEGKALLIRIVRGGIKRATRQNSQFRKGEREISGPESFTEAYCEESRRQ